MNFKALTDNEVNALAPHTFKYSIAILQHYRRDKNYVGSGTLIQIASRFFIATAGHNLVDVPDKCLYMGYSKKKVYEQLPFISRKPPANEREPDPDVGYLEILPETAVLMNEKEFLPLNRPRPFVAAWPTRVFLTGFPAEMVPHASALKNRFDLPAIGYLTEIRKASELPGQHDESSDIFIDYDLNSIFVEKQPSMAMPKSPGLSGGGLWALSINYRSELWTPSDTTLIGIERSWLENSSSVRCTQIQHWLRCVADDYPDLTKIIDEYLRSRESGGIGS